MNHSLRLTIFALVTAMLVTACGAVSNATTNGSEPVSAAPTATATPGQDAAHESAPPANENSGASEAADQAPSSTPVPVEHLVTPGEPTIFDLQTIFDCNTGLQVQKNGEFQIGLGCDIWQKNSLERPQTSGDYDARFDIVQAHMGIDQNWYFFQIETFDGENASQALNGTYGIEIDMNLDTRGDLLLLVSDPAHIGESWDVAGVQVWFDSNDDVGADVPISPDNGGSDGYETLIFDQGVGDDPDLAWARIAPGSPHMVELAFKNTLLQSLLASSPNKNNGLSLVSLQVYDLFEWWAWAADTLDPLGFDFVDSYEQGNLQSVDNTCAWIYGGQPRPLANLCPYSTPTPTPKPTREQVDSCKEPEPSCGAIYGSSIWNPDTCTCDIIN